MSRGGNAGHRGHMPDGNYGGSGGGSSQANISQMANDLSNLGLDPNTLKKLSMSGIREFIPPGPPGGGGTPQGPPPSSGPPNNTSSTADNSGSSSPYPGSNYGSGSNQQRLQPPHSGIGSYGSPRASPTPSGSSSISSMMPAGSEAAMSAAAAAAAAAGGDPNMGVHPVQYSDGGTTYFYSSDEMQV